MVSHDIPKSRFLQRMMQFKLKTFYKVPLGNQGFSPILVFVAIPSKGKHGRRKCGKLYLMSAQQCNNYLASISLWLCCLHLRFYILLFALKTLYLLPEKLFPFTGWKKTTVLKPESFH